MEETPTILIIGYVWPEPSSSAAGTRMMQLISIFQDAGWEITFASSSAESEHMADLETRGIKTEAVEINRSTFDSFIQELQPDIVMFDRFVVEEQFGWRVAEHAPDALRILDTEDLHCLRRTRHEAVKQGSDFSDRDLLASDVANREIASIYRCDLTLMISEYEMELLTDLFGVDKSLLHYLPFLMDTIDEKTTERWPSFEERKHFVTIGNFRHPPNWDSVRYLKEKIWPLIRKELPAAELHIYGAYPSQKVTDLHMPGEGFYIEGRAEDAKEILGKGRVCLAPLRFGAGLKGKLVEAMQSGTPCITTSIGAEGINGDLEWNAVVVNNPVEISAEAVHLYSDKTSWEKSQQQGIDIVNSRFQKDDFELDLIERVKSMGRNLESHRLQNFTGHMLMHHTMASTRYMSKWIEEKNRSKSS
ncbi:glycosyltransferase family 4 protein [Aliifodinibius sp. S!AR15-10]|uniref:glycosyltransferase n=1 Tax=Aliifodinibius sp. S!AR15-10 TaxID=2950437 RepID=UPI00285E8D22|nr:glycosyltransferase [Aliifodinibius sp. S!AR15-10]MDR8389634.1 glycosyltransferase family 4 protein [Aliifodinibius sp. S!AR15-10]